MSHVAVRVRVTTERSESCDLTNFPLLWTTESEKIIDHANPSDRKWLGSHCFWAMRNGRRVTTTPVS